MCACQALKRERERRRREGAPDEVVTACERDILVLLLEHLQMQMQSGHTERAVACIQALLEFKCFSPDFPGVSHPACHSSHHGQPSVPALEASHKVTTRPGKIPESSTLCGADIYSKQRAFRDFWMSGAPLIGDDGAAGWNASILRAAAPAAAPAEGRSLA